MRPLIYGLMAYANESYELMKLMKVLGTIK